MTAGDLFPTFKRAGGAIKAAAATNVGGSIAGVAKWGLGLGMARDAFDTGKDPAFLILIFSLPVYFGALFASWIPFLAPYIGTVSIWLKGAFSTFLALPLIIWFLQKGKGLWFSVIFVIWYFFQQQTTNVTTIAFLLGIYFAIIFIFKFQAKGRGVNEGFGSILFEDILYAVVPIFIWFLDVGLVEWLIRTLNFQFLDQIKNVLVFLPFWTLYSLFKIRKQTTTVNVLQGLGILYIITILTVGIAPNVAGGDLLPTVDDFGQAKEDLRAEINQGENPFITQWSCTFKHTTNPNQIQQCIIDRQAESKCEKHKDTNLPDDENEDYQDCIAEAKGITKQRITGAIDPRIKEYTKVEIKQGSIESGQRTSNVLLGTQAVPIEIITETPRNEIILRPSCSIKTTNRTISATIQPEEITVEKTREGYPDRQVVQCRPQEQLPEGQVTFEIIVELKDMETFSSLTRAFISPTTTLERVDDIRRTFVSGNIGSVQSAPEFARLKFNLGNPPDDPIISGEIRKSTISLQASIENIGGGKLTQIHSAEINIGTGLTPLECDFSAPSGKLVKKNIQLNEDVSKRKDFRIGSCTLQIADEIRGEIPEGEFLLRDDFTAVLQYDYQLEKQFMFQVIES